jgi:creatinine amidohydrolase
VTDFRAMGLDRAYAGAPAAATAGEGEELYRRLADMVVGEVVDALGDRLGAATPSPAR